MDSPIRAASLALIFGAILGRSSLVSAGSALLAASLAAALSWLVLLAVRRRGVGARIRWTLVVVIVGTLAGAVHGLPPERGPPAPAMEVAFVEGVVRTAPPAPRTSEPAAADDEHLPDTDVAFDIVLPGGGIARVAVTLDSAQHDSIPDFLPGDGVRVLGRIRPRRGPTSPGRAEALDPAAATRIDVDAASAGAIVRVPQAFGVGDLVRRAGERLRRLLIRRLHDACGDGPAFGILACALTGDRTALPRDTARAFRDSGTAHLLSVSGLHLVLLTAVFAAIGRRLVTGRAAHWLALPATIALVLTFAAACRFETPVVRAGIFVVTRSLARTVHRRPDALDQLALAAAIIVAWDPSQVFDLGFQLSFAAVAGLILYTRRLREALFPDLAILMRFKDATRGRRFRVMLWASSALPATIAAQTTTAPIVAAAFGTAQPGGLVANLFAVPAFGVLLPLAAALATLGSAGAFLVAPANFVVTMLIRSLDLLSAVPGATVLLGRPPPAVFITSMLIALAGLGFRRWTRRHLWFPILSMGTLFVTPFLHGSRTDVVVLDVGHGLCVLARSAEGGQVLYDCGGRATAVGDRVVLPALRELGVRHLDALFLSHEDADHVNGALDVMHAIPVAEVIVPSGFGRSPLAQSVLGACAVRRVPVRALARGDRWSARGVAADVLHPEDLPRMGAENGDSLVLDLTLTDAENRPLTVLLTGDLEGEPLDLLVAVLERAPPPSYRADVVVLPHHGRASFGAQVRMIAAVNAAVAVASASDPESRLPAGAWSTSARGSVRIRAVNRSARHVVVAEAWPWPLFDE